METDFREGKVGRFPSEWQVVKLDEALSLLRNGIVTSQNKEGKGFPVTRIETISNERIDLDKLGYLEKTDGLNYADYRLVEGDILFSHINSLEHIGKVAIYKGIPEFLLHGMNLLLLRTKRDAVKPRYLLYLLKLFKRKRFFRAIAKTAVNQASINQTELARVRVPIPSIFEQQEIADVLSCVDLAIQKTNDVIDKTERLKNGMMQKLLTKGIGHKEFKDQPIEQMPETWQIMKLERLSEDGIRNGLFKRRHEFGSGAPLINVLDLFNGLAVIFQKLARVTVSEGELQQFQVKAGDILFCRSSLNVEGVGHACLVGDVPEPTVFECHVMRIRPRKNIVLPEYLVVYCLSSCARRFILAHSKTTTMTTIDQVDLGKLPIVLPPLPEQGRIAEVAYAVEKKLELERNQKAKLERIKQGLMDLLLFGKVRIGVD